MFFNLEQGLYCLDAGRLVGFDEKYNQEDQISNLVRQNCILSVHPILYYLNLCVDLVIGEDSVAIYKNTAIHTGFEDKIRAFHSHTRTISTESNVDERSDEYEQCDPQLHVGCVV